jgi:two-component system copper resistance phosphate regulon response regulator CusR
MRLLLVEDSEKLRAALREQFAALGWAVDEAGDGAQALAFVDAYPYDIVVLDLMMPKVDGISFLRQLRAKGLTTRVLVLSARDQVGDRIEALNQGADDYLVKPFDFDELNSRVQALMRRTLDAPTTILGAEGVELDTAKRIARVNGSPVELTPKEQALLEILLRRRGSVQSRGMLFEHLYDSRSATADKVIEVLVSTLRAKLNKAGAGQLIETRRGFGYLIR